MCVRKGDEGNTIEWNRTGYWKWEITAFNRGWTHTRIYAERFEIELWIYRIYLILFSSFPVFALTSPSISLYFAMVSDNFSDQFNIIVASCDFFSVFTNTSLLCLHHRVLRLMGGAGFCVYVKSHTQTAPKEHFDEQWGCKPDFLMLYVIVMACVHEWIFRSCWVMLILPNYKSTLASKTNLAPDTQIKAHWHTGLYKEDMSLLIYAFVQQCSM